MLNGTTHSRGWSCLRQKSEKTSPCYQTPLLPLNAAHEHLQKLFRIHLGANFRVRLDFVDASDHVTVAIRKIMQHLSLTGSSPVRHRCPARELPSPLTLHLPRLLL